MQSTQGWFPAARVLPASSADRKAFDQVRTLGHHATSCSRVDVFVLGCCVSAYQKAEHRLRELVERHHAHSPTIADKSSSLSSSSLGSSKRSQSASPGVPAASLLVNKTPSTPSTAAAATMTTSAATTSTLVASDSARSVVENGDVSGRVRAMMLVWCVVLCDTVRSSRRRACCFRTWRARTPS
jgi:hypothetical protein